MRKWEKGKLETRTQKLEGRKRGQKLEEKVADRIENEIPHLPYLVKMGHSVVVGGARRTVKSCAAHSKTEWPAHDSTDAPRFSYAAGTEQCGSGMEEE